MYGLPQDTNLDFFVGASLLQVCVGENELILNCYADISVMIASAIRVVGRSNEAAVLDDARSQGIALLGLLGHVIEGASGTLDGTLRLTWDDGTSVEILDSYAEFESYTVRHGDELIVV